MNEYHHRQIVETDRLRQGGDPSVQAECPSPEAELLKDEWNRLVQEAVDRLSPQCRAALALRVFHQCSYKEVADRLGISPRTAEKHIARGLRETHSYLERRYNTTRQGHG